MASSGSGVHASSALYSLISAGETKAIGRLSSARGAGAHVTSHHSHDCDSSLH